MRWWPGTRLTATCPREHALKSVNSLNHQHLRQPAAALPHRRDLRTYGIREPVRPGHRFERPDRLQPGPSFGQVGRKGTVRNLLHPVPEGYLSRAGFLKVPA